MQQKMQMLVLSISGNRSKGFYTLDCPEFAQGPDFKGVSPSFSFDLYVQFLQATINSPTMSTAEPG